MPVAATASSNAERRDVIGKTADEVIEAETDFVAPSFFEGMIPLVFVFVTKNTAKFTSFFSPSFPTAFIIQKVEFVLTFLSKLWECFYVRPVFDFSGVCILNFKCGGYRRVYILEKRIVIFILFFNCNTPPPPHYPPSLPPSLTFLLNKTKQTREF